MNDPAGAPPAPETVTEAVQLLTAMGYTDELEIVRGGVALRGDGKVEPTATAVVDHTFRFEGDSDPGDEAIVLGVRCPTTGARGIVVSAYGPDVDAEHAEVLLALTVGNRGGT